MTDNDWLMELLLDVHRGLPRQGPGDDASTLRALEMCTELPMRPDMLDVGCGPGMQTVALAAAAGGTITAVDLFEQFLDQLRERADVAGVREQIQVMRGDMKALPFGRHSFDLIWSEGAAYIMGITEAFTSWKEFLRPRGYFVVSEIAWLVPDVPEEVYDFLHGQYPDITDVPGNLARIGDCGYEIVGHFTLPNEAWWSHYYTPLADNLVAMREKYALDPRALEFIGESEEEQRIRREFPDTYGYEFIVARALDPDAPGTPGTPDAPDAPGTPDPDG